MFSLRIQKPALQTQQMTQPTLITSNQLTTQTQQLIGQTTRISVYANDKHDTHNSRERLRMKIAESQNQRRLRVNWSALKM